MRTLFTARWLAWHVLCLVFVGACVFGFVWQFTKAESPLGDWQNILYAIQWPIFAVCGGWAWGRAIWLHFHPPGAIDPPLLYDDPDPGRVVHDLQPRMITAAPHYDDYVEPDDPELVAYNARLARLNAKES